MIQSWIVEQLQPLFPDFAFTVDFEAEGEHAATVYYEGGGEPGTLDFGYRYPRYMIWIESPDWGLSEFAANEFFKHLKKLREIPIVVEYTDAGGKVLGTEHVHLRKIVPQGEPQRMGVEDDKMIYNINIDTTLLILEGENSNG